MQRKYGEKRGLGVKEERDDRLRGLREEGREERAEVSGLGWGGGGRGQRREGLRRKRGD